MLAIVLSALLAPSVFAAATTPVIDKPKSAETHFADLWTSLPVAEALKQATEQNKPVLLYWGAVWCPPCNQLKSQVFSHPEFASTTEPFVRIMLDGDLPGAQEWADKLNVSGYPTVLILAPEKPGRKTIMKERLRLVEFVAFSEFKNLTQSALSASLPLEKDLIRKGLRSKATPQEWQLIGFTWSQVETTGKSSDREIKRTLKQLKTLFKNCPDKRVKSVLAARILNLGSEIRKEWLDAVTGDSTTLLAARGPFLSGAAHWLERTPAPVAKSTGKQILSAANILASDATISPAEKLQSQTVILDITSQLVAKSWSAKSDLAVENQKAVKLAREIAAASKSAFERHAVVTDAAMLLFVAGQASEAKKMLVDEAKASDTPWYYESGLAGISLQEKDFPAALEWSKKAKLSARGDATKLQWLVSDINLQSQVLHELDESTNPATIAMITKQEEIFKNSVAEWLQLALSLPDGFSGRNALRARKVRGAINNWSNDQERRALLTNWAESCKILKKTGKTDIARNCQSFLK